MWAKLGQWFTTSVLIPWAKKSMVALYEWVLNKYKTWKEKKERTKKNKKKLKEYQDAENENDVRDSFSNLP